MTTTHTPRGPNEQELQELAAYVVDKTLRSYTSDDIGDMLMQLEDTYIAVFENYITDCPGYAGPLMVVVWGGGPEYHEVYIWQRETASDSRKLLRVPGDT